MLKGKRALKDLNPRHLILETSVLPTELRTLNSYYSLTSSILQDFTFFKKNILVLLFKISKNQMNKVNKQLREIAIKKYLPHNFLAEKVILSSLLANPEGIEIIFNHLTVETFYFKNHQELYKIMVFFLKKKFQSILSY